MEEAIHSRVKPVQLKGEHHSNIFCLAFNSGNTKVFSGGKERRAPWFNMNISCERLGVEAMSEILPHMTSRRCSQSAIGMFLGTGNTLASTTFSILSYLFPNHRENPGSSLPLFVLKLWKTLSLLFPLRCTKSRPWHSSLMLENIFYYSLISMHS